MNCQGSGKSSFDLIDQERFFTLLGARPGMTLLDLGCGSGNYTVEIAKRNPSLEKVIGIDAWEKGISDLLSRKKENNLSNIHAFQAQAGKLPLSDNEIDICLMGTVLHDLLVQSASLHFLTEIKRVLKPQGKIIVIEFEKISGPPGPPENIRITPQETSSILSQFDFVEVWSVPIGKSLYFSLFENFSLKNGPSDIFFY